VGSPRLYRRSTAVTFAKRSKRATADIDLEQAGRTRKGRKKTIDALASSIGLKPTANFTLTRKESKSLQEGSSALVKPASEINIATQLDYARNGHAVFHRTSDSSK